MKEVILCRDIDFAGLYGDFLNVPIVNLVPVGSDEDGATTVKATNMASRGGDKDAADLSIAVGLGISERVMHALSGDSKVDDLSLAHTA